MTDNNIIGQLESIVSDSLNSANLPCSFIPEAAKEVEFEILNSLGKQGIVCVIQIPEADFTGMSDNNHPAFETSDLELVVIENPTVNRSKNDFTAWDIAERAASHLVALGKIGEAGSIAMAFGKFCLDGISQEIQGQLLVVTAKLKALPYVGEDSK